MAVIELFGISGSGKSTITSIIKQEKDIHTPILENMQSCWLRRNALKLKKVIKVIIHNRDFSIKLFKIIWIKKKSLWATLRSYYNFNYYGYFNIVKHNGTVLLDEGISQQVWDLYGYDIIDDKDKKNIVLIIEKFNCSNLFVIDSSINDLIQRNLNRNKKTYLLKKIDNIDFIYYNFYELISVIQKTEVTVYTFKNIDLMDSVGKIIKKIQEIS